MSLLSKDAFCTVKLSSSSPSPPPPYNVGSQTWCEVLVRPTPRDQHCMVGVGGGEGRLVGVEEDL